MPAYRAFFRPLIHIESPLRQTRTGTPSQGGENGVTGRQVCGICAALLDSSGSFWFMVQHCGAARVGKWLIAMNTVRQYPTLKQGGHVAASIARFRRSARGSRQ